MHWRSGDHGYGVVSKTLHWVTVLALAAQFWVGWTMEADDDAFAADKARIEQLEEQAKDLEGPARDTAREEVNRLEDALDARSDEAEDEFVRESLRHPTEPSLPLLHVGLGVLVMCLGAVRIAWRRTGLPPWAEHLGPTARTVAGATEKVLLASLFVMPGSGILLVLAGAEWLPLHVASHVVFGVALLVHVGLHLAHARHGHLRRML